MSIKDNILGKFEEKIDLDEELIKGYFVRNERKNEDDKWLKENGAKIKEVMLKLNKDKADIGKLRISVSVPIKSNFDMSKVLDYVLKNHEILCKEGALLDYKVNEEFLEQYINDGIIDIEALKEYAWVGTPQSPRLSIKKISKGD